MNKFLTGLIPWYLAAGLLGAAWVWKHEVYEVFCWTAGQFAKPFFALLTWIGGVPGAS